MVEQGKAKSTDLYDIITNRNLEVTEESAIEMRIRDEWEMSKCFFFNFTNFGKIECSPEVGTIGQLQNIPAMRALSYLMS